MGKEDSAQQKPTSWNLLDSLKSSRNVTVPCLFLISYVTSVLWTNLSSESVKFFLRTLCFRKRTLSKTTTFTSGSSPCFHPRRWLIGIWSTYYSIVKPRTETRQANGNGSRIIIVSTSTILQRNLFKMTSGKEPKSMLPDATKMRTATSQGQMSSRQLVIVIVMLCYFSASLFEENKKRCFFFDF